MIAIITQHSAYLAGGFAMNLLISACAMLAGTGIGAGLGALRFHRPRGLTGAARLATSICRNVPSFVLLFYMASMIPAEIELAGNILPVPLWIKATLALIFPAIGFASDQVLAWLTQSRAGLSGASETFAIAWMQYFLIIIMASATASVIGADDIVGRANNLISQQDSSRFMLLVYLYISGWFIAAGLLFSGAMTLALRRRKRP